MIGRVLVPSGVGGVGGVREVRGVRAEVPETVLIVDNSASMGSRRCRSGCCWTVRS